jgi:hypothetical protein
MRFCLFPHKMSHQPGISRALRAPASCLCSLLLMIAVCQCHPVIQVCVHQPIVSPVAAQHMANHKCLASHFWAHLLSDYSFPIFRSWYLTRISLQDPCDRGFAPIPLVGHCRCKNGFFYSSHILINFGLIPYLSALVVLIHIRVYKKIADA